MQTAYRQVVVGCVDVCLQECSDIGLKVHLPDTSRLVHQKVNGLIFVALDTDGIDQILGVQIFNLT